MLDSTSIMQILGGIDDHLRKLESFMGLLREVKISVTEMRLALDRQNSYELQKQGQKIDEIRNQLYKYGMPEINHYEQNFQETKSIMESFDWTEAISPELICDNDIKADQRADYILELFIGECLEGKNFLDYGCGKGEVVKKALAQGANAIGYEVGQSFDEIKNHGPYDIILVHDVLDHIVMIDPITALHQIKSLLKPKGRIYLRCHPFSSRHGGHLYLQKNKAFIHLVFDEVELARMGISPEHNIKVVTPLDTYRFWINQVDLKIVSEMPIRNNVEEFFTKPSPVVDRIKKYWDTRESMINNMEISMVDYVLEQSNHHIF